LTIFRVIYLGWNAPLADKKANRMLIFGEIFVLVVNDHLYIFTDFSGGIKGKEVAGKSLIFVTVLVMVIYLVVIF
jgi:hypothetical protein